MEPLNLNHCNFQQRKWPDLNLKSPGIKPRAARTQQSTSSSLSFPNTLTEGLSGVVPSLQSNINLISGASSLNLISNSIMKSGDISSKESSDSLKTSDLLNSSSITNSTIGSGTLSGEEETPPSSANHQGQDYSVFASIMIGIVIFFIL